MFHCNYFLLQENDEDSPVKSMADSQDESAGICEYCDIALNDSASSENNICFTCIEENRKSDCQDVNNKNPTYNVNAIQLKNEIKVEQNLKSEKCRSCDSVNLIEESINGDERLICSDCGVVNSGETLTTSEITPLTRTAHNNVQTLPWFSGKRGNQVGLQAGLSKIDLLCDKYCFSSNFRSETKDMYRNFFFHSVVLHTKITTKEDVSAACLFIVCRQNNLPITMSHFRNDVNKFKSFLIAVKHAIKFLGITLPSTSITDQLASFLSDYKFGRISERVKKILFLCREAWLTEGRSRPRLLALATYYAYISSNLCEKYTTWRHFCKQFKMPCPSSTLVKECEELFMKLAQSLPWVPEGKVTVKNFYLYFNDIFQHQIALFHLVFKSNDIIKRDANIKSVHNLILSKRIEKEVLLPSSAKKARLKYDPVHIDSPIPQGIDLDSTELKEDEFEDDEIDSYILSPQEQADLREHKMSLWSK